MTDTRTIPGATLHDAFTSAEGGWSGTPPWAALDENARRRWAANEARFFRLQGMTPPYGAEPEPEPQPELFGGAT